MNCKSLILDMIDEQVDHYLDQFLDKDYGTESFAQWAGKRLGVELDARDFRGLDFAAGPNAGQGRSRAGGRRPGARRHRGEPAGEAEQSEWNWEALAKMVNTRWKLNLRDRDLKKIGRDELGELLIDKRPRGDRRST